jgi:hypothetical protein
MINLESFTSSNSSSHLLSILLHVTVRRTQHGILESSYTALAEIEDQKLHAGRILSLLFRLLLHPSSPVEIKPQGYPTQGARNTPRTRQNKDLGYSAPVTYQLDRSIRQRKAKIEAGLKITISETLNAGISRSSPQKCLYFPKNTLNLISTSPRVTALRPGGNQLEHPRNPIARLPCFTRHIHLNSHSSICIKVEL